MTTKRALRAHYRQVCGDVSAEQRAHYARQATHHLFELPALKAAQTVALFSSHDAFCELETQHLHMALRAQGSQCHYPRVIGDSLSFAQVDDLQELVVGHYGLLEPNADHPESQISSFDLVIVPGLAFTPQGDRLGRGGGYYDRFLSHPHLTAVTVGWAMSCQLTDALPTETHDRRVLWVATEGGVVI